MRIAIISMVLLCYFVGVPTSVRADEIDDMCRLEWGSNRDMVNYCINNQRTAKREVSSHSGLIRINCESEWGNNYEMVLYCINNQSTARQNLQGQPDDVITRFCKNEWGNNFEMIQYCTDGQRAAKRTLDQSYQQSGKRNGCEREWGTNYEMVLYCVRN